MYYSIYLLVGKITWYCTVSRSVADPCLWLVDPDSTYYFLKVHLHHFSKIKSQKEVTKQYEARFFLLFLFDDKRIRIHTSDKWIRIQEAQKHTHPDPQHWFQVKTYPRPASAPRSAGPAAAALSGPRYWYPSRAIFSPKFLAPCALNAATFYKVQASLGTPANWKTSEKKTTEYIYFIVWKHIIYK